MKTIFTILFSMMLSLSLLAQTAVEVTTGAGYADEVYYSLENDVLKTAPRANWDIAFVTAQMSVSVLANNGTNVMVYTWNKGGAADWANVDTTGMNWTPMYNSVADWEYGALNANTIPGDAFDYGWGRYNMANHTITGDSIFILKLQDESFKKFLVKQKNAMQNVWTIQYANLDGTNDTTVTIDAKQYKTTKYVHYSVANNAIVDQEPSEKWHLLFTKYFDYNIPYYVTGILANSGVKIQQVEGVSQPDFKDYDTMMFTDTISQIGSDWKSYDFTAGWVVNDNTVYFVQDTTSADKAVWKIYFTGFGGMGTGMYSFIKEKMNATSVNDISERSLVVYPNPASNQINVIHDFKGDAEFTVYNLAGQPVIKTKNVEGSGLNKQNMDISALPIGMYSLQVRSGNDIKTVKFIKR